MNRSYLESYGGYESPQIRRDRFLFFLIIASIAHLFVILNTTHIINAPQHYPPMEIIFSEEKYKEIKQERATDSNARETNNNSSESTPRTALRDPGKIKLDEDQARQKDKLRRPNAEQLIARSLAQASKHYDLLDNPYFSGNKPRRKYISANNKDHRFASYMEAWRAKVERVGNINYPHEARKKHLSGKLLLDVAIQRDGTVQQIIIRRSSGNKILDQAAIKIVKLAAPFAPLPENIAREVDILHITRTWNFVNDSQFTTP